MSVWIDAARADVYTMRVIARHLHEQGRCLPHQEDIITQARRQALDAVAAFLDEAATIIEHAREQATA